MTRLPERRCLTASLGRPQRELFAHGIGGDPAVISILVVSLPRLGVQRGGKEHGRAGQNGQRDEAVRATCCLHIADWNLLGFRGNRRLRMLVRLFAYVGVGLLVYGSVSSAADSDARLAEAARREDRSAIRALVAQKAEVNAPLPDGSTALHWAVQADDLESVNPRSGPARTS
jgi:hypothetical protein